MLITMVHADESKSTSQSRLRRLLYYLAALSCDYPASDGEEEYI